MKKNSILLLTLVFFSCVTTKRDKNENIFWINSAKTECVGVAPMSCLQIQKRKTIIQNNWELFYTTIEGFDYQPGFIYKLNVKEEHFENVPADASSIKYTLVEVLEKKKDKRLEIQDIWILESLNGVIINSESISKRPQIEINVTQMKVFGTNGCNNVSGSIKTLDDSNIEFSELAETRMMCPNMEVSRQFSFALTKTMNYKKTQNQLVFFNRDGKEILVFKKTD